MASFERSEMAVKNKLNIIIKKMQTFGVSGIHP